MVARKHDSLRDFAGSESERLEEERKKNMDEKDFKPFVKIADMETVWLDFMDTPIRESKKYPKSKIFRVKKEGQEYDFAVNSQAPHYRDIINNLKQGKFRMRISRSGTGMTDTRYKVTT